MIRKQLLFKNERGNPLVVLIPGGTGTMRPQMPGFSVMASHFWLNGCTAYIAETNGQDGHDGYFSLRRCLNEIEEVLDYLQTELQPEQTVIFGSCSGGTIATHIAAERKCNALVLWETLPQYNQASRNEFIQRAEGRVVLAPKFLSEYIETKDKASKVRCHVLSCYGTGMKSPVFVDRDASELRSMFTSASTFAEITVPGADHNLTRGSNFQLLGDLLTDIVTRLKSELNLTNKRS